MGRVREVSGQQSANFDGFTDFAVEANFLVFHDFKLSATLGVLRSVAMRLDERRDQATTRATPMNTRRMNRSLWRPSDGTYLAIGTGAWETGGRINRSGLLFLLREPLQGGNGRGVPTQPTTAVRCARLPPRRCSGDGPGPMRYAQARRGCEPGFVWALPPPLARAILAPVAPAFIPSEPR
jgi:hypothetical protein